MQSWYTTPEIDQVAQELEFSRIYLEREKARRLSEEELEWMWEDQRQDVEMKHSEIRAWFLAAAMVAYVNGCLLALACLLV